MERHNIKEVERETGEIISSRVIYTQPGEVVRAFDPHDTGRGHKFIKIKNGRDAKRRIRQLENNEAGFLFKIAQYASPNMNILLGDSEHGIRGKPLKLSDLIRICQVSKPTGMKIVRSLVQKNAIGFIEAEGIKKAFVINPDYLLNGKRPDPNLVEVFRSGTGVIDFDDLE